LLARVALRHTAWQREDQRDEIPCLVLVRE
jgi:hypothetical protein